MAFRFRKSFNFGGARVNFSKSGIGASVGGKGCRVTKKAGGGTRTTVGIPGTGLSYQEDSKQKSKTKSAVSAVPASPAYTFFWIMFTILGFPLVALGALLMLAEPVIGAAFVAFGIILLIAARHYKKKNSKKVGQRETTDT